MDNQTPDLLRQALIGMLMGGGAYGSLRLMQDMGNASQKPQKSKDELQLTLPAARMPKTAADPMDYLLPLLTTGGGAAGGFLGASKLYDTLRKRKLEEQQKSVEEEYMKTLTQAHHKVASAQTPLIDKFLEGLITKAGEELRKEGLFGADVPSEGVFDTIKHIGGKAVDGAAHSELGSAAIATWLAGVLGTGGLTYGIARNMDKNRQKNKEQTTLPSEIKLNVV